MQNVPNIQHLSPLDTHLVAGIHQACFPRPWSAIEFQRLLALESVFGLLAVCDESPVGFILIQYVLDEAEILTVAIHPNHQRQGTGTRLIAAIERSLQNKGVNSLFLEVSVLNNPALNLYQKLGFHRIGTRPNYFPHAADPTAELLKKELSK